MEKILSNLADKRTLTPEVSTADHIQSEGTIDLVEYGDFQCEHCRKAYPELEKIVEDPDLSVRFVFRHFPLRSQHPQAQLAAEISEAAASQGRFWQMHSLLFKHQKDFDYQIGLELAGEIGLNLSAFEADLTSHRFAEKIQDDFESGVHSGVNGTPTLFIQGRRYNGEKTYEALKQTLLSI